MQDLISRQAAIAHLKKRLIETAINNIGVIVRCDSIFEDTADNRIGPWINELPSAQPEIAERTTETAQNVSDGDLISRKAAIDALHMHLMYRLGTDSNKKRLDEWVNNLPSAQPKSYREGYQAGYKDAQPERKKGKWELWRCDMYKCSECGYIYTELSIDRCEANYCPHCGADMREVDDERLIYTRNNSRDV